MESQANQILSPWTLSHEVAFDIIYLENVILFVFFLLIIKYDSISILPFDF